MNLRGSGIFAQDVSSETHQYHQFHKEMLNSLELNFAQF